ncbi:MAG: M24 family metallopeptidase, partial [Patescibacteria group bacterium]
MITIKTEKEIALLREGGKRHAIILSALASAVRPGLKTSDLNDLAVRLIMKGGDTPAFLHYTPKGASRPYPAAVCISVNNEVVHGIPHENPRILKVGDIVSLDLGITHNGMITDAAVTVPVGKISSISQTLIDVTHKALKAGIVAARGGNHVGDIGYAVSQVVQGSTFSIVE